MTKLDRDIVLQTLAGYAEVDKITEAERRARLERLTDAEARAIFDDLSAGWDRSIGDDGSDWRGLDRWRIEQKIEVRRAFERLARAKGLL